MNSSEEESESLISSDAVNDCTLQDDLFILKQSILSQNKLAGNYISFLNQIYNILQDRPEFSHLLYRWNFLTNELLYTMRARATEQSIKIATIIIRETKQIPEFYYTKKFIFFLTEKLYLSNEFRDPENTSQIGSVCPVKATCIIELATEMIVANRSIANILYEMEFFTLVSAVITHETCKLYDSIFSNIYFSDQIDDLKLKSFEKDAMFEIQRNNFDSEIVFRNKEIIELKSHNTKFKRGVYEKIYNECANLKHLINLSVKDTFGLILYKRMAFMNDELDLLILDGNDLAIKAYRRGLEEGGLPEQGYLIALLRSIGDKKANLDAVICLYYLIDYIVDGSKFDHEKIRKIFECLEYKCDPECSRNHVVDKVLDEIPHKNSNLNTVSQSGDFINCSIANESLNSIYCTNLDFKDHLISDDLIKNPGDILTKRKRSESENITLVCDFESQVNVNRCSRLRIILLLKHLYEICNKDHFYKPSYLILMKSNIHHCNSEEDFINKYFKDFLAQLSNSQFIVQALFPVKPLKQKKIKTRIVTLDDPVENMLNETDKVDNASEEKDIDLKRIKVKGNMIDSDDSADINTSLLQKFTYNG